MDYIQYSTPVRKRQGFKKRNYYDIPLWLNNFYQQYTLEKKLTSFTIVVTDGMRKEGFTDAVNEIKQSFKIIKFLGNDSGSGPEWEIAMADFGKALDLMKKYKPINSFLIRLNSFSSFRWDFENKFLKPFSTNLKNFTPPSNYFHFIYYDTILAFKMDFSFPFAEMNVKAKQLIADIESILHVELKEKNFGLVYYDQKTKKEKFKKIETR